MDGITKRRTNISSDSWTQSRTAFAWLVKTALIRLAHFGSYLRVCFSLCCFVLRILFNPVLVCFLSRLSSPCSATLSRKRPEQPAFAHSYSYALRHIFQSRPLIPTYPHKWLCHLELISGQLHPISVPQKLRRVNWCWNGYLIQCIYFNLPSLFDPTSMVRPSGQQIICAHQPAQPPLGF